MWETLRPRISKRIVALNESLHLATHSTGTPTRQPGLFTGAGARRAPVADASSRLAAIEHRQSQLRQQAALATAGHSHSEPQVSRLS